MVVSSPCVHICKYNFDLVCKGCGRTENEITRWHTMNDEQKMCCKELASKRQKFFSCYEEVC